MTRLGSISAAHDTQLDKAIEVVTQRLKEHPSPRFVRPSYANLGAAR
jgi:hypothetical protein